MSEVLRFELSDLPMPMAFATFRIIRDCNAEFAVLFGLTRDEVIDRSFARLYPEISDFARIGETWKVGLTSSPVFYDERLMRGAGGQKFWCAVHGRTLTPADPFMEAIYCFQPIARPARLDDTSLTRRQQQILALIAQGRTNGEIAQMLRLSRRTIESHRARLMRQVGVANAAELMAWFSVQNR